MGLGTVESLVVATLASSRRPMAMWELRELALREYRAERLDNGTINERSFAASFSRALRTLERKGFVRLSLRPNVAQWPHRQAARGVYRVELGEALG